MKEPIILLHGWGLQGNKYKEIASYFTKRGHAVFTPDMPGFGSEKLSSSSLFLKDYVAFIHTVVKRNKLKNIIFIGHSFGGRVLLKYVAMYPESVKKIIMTGVPIIRHTSLRKKTGFLVAKIGGLIVLFFP